MYEACNPERVTCTPIRIYPYRTGHGQTAEQPAMGRYPSGRALEQHRSAGFREIPMKFISKQESCQCKFGNDHHGSRTKSLCTQKVLSCGVCCASQAEVLHRYRQTSPVLGQIAVPQALLSTRKPQTTISIRFQLNTLFPHVNTPFPFCLYSRLSLHFTNPSLFFSFNCSISLLLGRPPML